MEMTQLNIRIPAELKIEGDQVLARNKKSASEMVRMLWAYLVKNQAIPSCLEDIEKQSLEDENAALSIENRGTVIVQDACKRLGIQNLCCPKTADSYKELEEKMYEELREEYGA